MTKNTDGNIIFRRHFCQDDKLMDILMSLQIIDPENIIKLANKRNLSKFCKDVGRRLKTAYEQMRDCSLSSSQRMYANLIDGVESLYETICLNEPYKHKFEAHSSCFKKLYNELDNCDGPKDWVEDFNKTRLCKAYENIVDCYMIKAALICGPEAADVFKKLLINVLRATVVTDCGIRTRSIGNKLMSPILTERTYEVIYLLIIIILILVLINFMGRSKKK
ncbi:uncharacterized protein [Halyomorpha halys]|uniref:uncharacterized protein n=1 Tax=Halyomorpha halys TaxID=286706 RepID=UPI0006D50E5E|nr:uncharacterized protein LOC106677918 isoform X2 [Halyomorpha halys]